jgi:hypothetical protein
MKKTGRRKEELKLHERLIKKTNGKEKTITVRKKKS